MNAINFAYSLKNIPTPSRRSYLKSLMNKVESFLRKIRWKAYFYENPVDDDSEKQQKLWIQIKFNTIT